LSFEFKKFNLFIGTNGSGKSTLFRLLQSPSQQPIMVNGSDMTSHNAAYATPFLLEESRNTIPTRYRQVPNVNTGNALGGFGNFDFENDIRIKDTNTELSNLFKRTIGNPVIQNQGRITAYSRNGKQIPVDKDGLGIKNVAKIFEVINTLENDSILLIEEIAQNIHPSFIGKVLDLIISKLDSKNIQLFATTQEIVSGLYFIKKMNEDDFKIYNFVDNDGVLDAHPIEKDTSTSILRDFLGDFPTQEDLDLMHTLNE